MTKNEALIENISKEGLKKLENFCSKFKGYKTSIDKKSYDKKAVGLCINLKTFKFYFLYRLVSKHYEAKRIVTNAKYRFNNVNEFIIWYKNIYLPLKNIVIIKHIPHASLKMPNGIGLDYDDEKYNLKMSDIGVDILFKDFKSIYFQHNFPNIKVYEINAKYSRLYCDVERFKDNKKEPMAKLGQGFIYEKYYDGKNIRRRGYVDYDAINNYYDEHHKTLNDLVRKQIIKGKDILILDLHSYSDDLAIALGKKGPFPDICIGYDKKYYNRKLLNIVIKEIEKRKLSYKINFPYKGSIIPSDVLNGKIKGNVYSIMIEVNKRLYL